MYQFQVKIFDHNKKEKAWTSIRPSGVNSKPYSYETFEEANKMMNMCYPLFTSEEARVVKIDL